MQHGACHHDLDGFVHDDAAACRNKPQLGVSPFRMNIALVSRNDSRWTVALLMPIAIGRFL
jgi:hypothetical protein